MPKIKKVRKNVLDLNAVFTEEDDGGYSVMIPVLPGCFSQGDTFEEAVENIREAIALYIVDEKEKVVTEHRVRREFMAPVELYV